MRLIFPFIIFNLSVVAVSNAAMIDFNCWDRQQSECVVLVQDELKVQGCQFRKADIQCEASGNDGEYRSCQVNSNNCDDATSDGFRGIKCKGDTKKVDIVDANLTLNWYFSYFGIRDYVESLCVPK